MSVIPARSASVPVAAVPARRARRPVGLLVVSTAIAVLLAVPLIFLLIESHRAGLGTVADQLFRPLTASLLWNTVRLAVVVTAACAVIGTTAAWLVNGPTCQVAGSGRYCSSYRSPSPTSWSASAGARCSSGCRDSAAR